MRKILLLLALVAGFSSQVYADFTAKNAAGTTITFKNPGDCTSVVCVPEQQIVDSTGTAVLGTTADSVCGTSTGTCSLLALLKYLNTQAASIVTNTGAAIPTQSSTVPIGGTSLCDGANGTTNPCTTAATVKAASTAPATTDKALVVGIAPNYSSKGGIPVVNGGSTYQLVAASATATALTGGGGGATGDYLSHCVVVPATTAPGVVTILDGASAIYSFPGGGTTALVTLIPFAIPVGAVSVNGAWKITTGTNVSVVCSGKFT